MARNSTGSIKAKPSSSTTIRASLPAQSSIEENEVAAVVLTGKRKHPSESELDGNEKRVKLNEETAIQTLESTNGHTTTTTITETTETTVSAVVSASTALSSPSFAYSEDEINAEATVKSLLGLSENESGWLRIQQGVQSWREKLTELERFIGNKEAEIATLRVELELSTLRKLEVENSLTSVSASHSSQTKTLQANIKTLQSSLEKANAQIASLNHLISEKEIALTVTKQRVVELERQLLPLENQVAQLSTDNGTLQTNFDVIAGEKERLEIHCSSLDATIKVQAASLFDLQKLNAKHRSTILDLESQLRTLDTEKFAKLRELEIALSSAQTSTSSIEQVKTHFVTEIAVLEEKIAEQNDMLDEFRTINSLNESTIVTLESTVATLSLEKDTTLQEYKTVVSSLQHALSLAEHKKSRFETEINSLSGTIDAQSSTARDLRLAIANLQNTISTLESSLAEKVAEKDSALSVLDVSNSQLKNTIAQRDSTLTDLETQLREKEAAGVMSARKIRRLEEMLEEKNRVIQETVARDRALETENDQMGSTIELLKGLVKEKEDAFEVVRGKLDKQIALTFEVQQETQQTFAALQSSEAELISIQSKWETSQNTIIQLEKTVVKSTTEVAALTTELVAATQMQETLRVQVRNALAAHNSDEKKQESIKESLRIKDAYTADLHAKLLQVESQLSAMKDQVDSASTSIKNLKASIVQKSTIINSLESQLEAEKLKSQHPESERLLVETKQTLQLTEIQVADLTAQLQRTRQIAFELVEKRDLAQQQLLLSASKTRESLQREFDAISAEGTPIKKFRIVTGAQTTTSLSATSSGSPLPLGKKVKKVSQKD